MGLWRAFVVTDKNIDVHARLVISKKLECHKNLNSRKVFHLNFWRTVL